MKTVTVSEMKEIEKSADEAGLSYYQMMENAGRTSYETLLSEYPETESLLIFCGKGNNGGDGLVAARYAALDGKKVTVIMVEGESTTSDAITNWHKLPENVDIKNINNIDVKALKLSDDKIIIIDAIYGTGFHGNLRESGRVACDMIKALDIPIVALDIPSGCDADNSTACEGAICADITIVFHAYKNVHISNLKNCGRCILVDIGINSK